MQVGVINGSTYTTNFSLGTCPSGHDLYLEIGTIFKASLMYDSKSKLRYL